MSVQGARLLSLLLAAACGVLLLLAFAMQLGFGRGYRWSAPDEDAAQSLAQDSVDRQPFKLPPQTAYEETLRRPLFNEDRQPTPDIPAEVGPPPAPPVQLNVALTGVILTPKVRIALLHDNAKNEQMSVKEGSPLPGDLGGWTLTRVKARSAMFKESAGDEVEVELSTAVASQKPGSPPHAAGATPPPPGQPVQAPVFGPKPPVPATGKPADSAQAEQMQRRIEERRKQMRDEAERLKQQANPNPQHQ